MANEITDPDLREKTIRMIQNPLPTNPDWRHSSIEFRKSPASANMHHCYSGGLMERTISVVKISSVIADVLASVHVVAAHHGKGGTVHRLLWRR